MGIDVTVVIINYNTFNLTCDCIRSIIANTKGVTYEIILIDNASTERHQNTFEELFPGIIVIENSENLGFAKGNNIGIKQAKGKYVLLLNSDTVLKNDATSIVKYFLDNNLNVGVATARLEYPNGDVQHNCQRFPSIKYQLAELLRLQKIFPSIRRNLFGPFFSYNSIVFPDWVWGTFFMFRKELIEKLPEKKLAEDFFMYVEDMQWCMEFKKLGYNIAFQPEAKVTHLSGVSGGKKNELMIKNLDSFMTQYYSPWNRKLISLLNKLLTKNNG